MNLYKKNKDNITYFSLKNNVNFNNEDRVVKRALVLIEGEQIDSKKRKHVFSQQRLENIVENTNALFESGGRVPLLMDHQKTQSNVVGDLESPLFIDIITEDNLPNPKLKSLIGKMGIFAEEIAIKSKKTIEQLKEGLANTISAGLDITDDCIKEISLTPTPAILGAALFHKNNNYVNFDANQPLTFDDLEGHEDELEEVKTKYVELSENLWKLTENIIMCDPEELNGVDPNELIQQVINDFVERYYNLIGMGENDEMNEQENDPRLMQQQGGNPNFNPNQQLIQTNPRDNRFKNNIPLAAFSMAEMENVNVEFGYRQAFSGAIRELGTRNQTGKTLGDIGNKFGRKFKNATQGKIAGIGRKLNTIKNTITGNKSKNKLGKLSNNQMQKASLTINKSGGRQLTKTGKFTPSSNLNTGKKQIRTKNNYVVGSPL